MKNSPKCLYVACPETDTYARGTVIGVVSVLTSQGEENKLAKIESDSGEVVYLFSDEFMIIEGSA